MLAAIDLHTGQRGDGSLPISTISTPWPAGDVVYATDQGGKVVCIARDSGQVYWIKDLNLGVKKKQRAIYSGPVLAANRLLLVDSLGALVALNPKNRRAGVHLEARFARLPEPHRGERHAVRPDPGGRSGGHPLAPSSAKEEGISLPPYARRA